MKNKINNYDFLIVGGGLIGQLTALSLKKRKFRVLVIEKEKNFKQDYRTLAVNANSRDFLIGLGLWDKLKQQSAKLQEIVIKDYINKDPLIFNDPNESLGSVIFNRDLITQTNDILLKSNSIIYNSNLQIQLLDPKKIININNNKFRFKKIILSVGKSIVSDRNFKKYSFTTHHNSYVGFISHKNNHNNKAYEIFTKQGPLALLPAPSKNGKKSTFIFSTSINVTEEVIMNLLKKNFLQTHGNITLQNKIFSYAVSPHLTRPNQHMHILVGDALRSIHPVAGQGWNLGVKDIQKLEEILSICSVDNNNFNRLYTSSRIIESTTYLFFTNFINRIYEENNQFSKLIVELGFQSLKNFKLIRRLFVKQAMGRLKLI